MGGSDCEVLGAGLLAQPTNAWSSGAYLVAAAYVLRHRGRSATSASSLLVAGALALALVSFGSIAYHGPQPSWGGAAHDASITALLVALVACQLVEAGDRAVRPVLVAAGAIVVLGAALVVTAWADPLLVHGLLGVALGGTAVHRGRNQLAGRRRWPRAAAVAFGSGLVLYVLGRTGGPLCSPSSPVQAHAGWHVLTAIAAAAALLARPGRRLPRGGGGTARAPGTRRVAAEPSRRGRVTRRVAGRPAGPRPSRRAPGARPGRPWGRAEPGDGGGGG